jgi:hypothetical protein
MGSQAKTFSITGNLAVDSRKDGRVWVAKHRPATGRFTRSVVGPAWVRDGGRRTPRGAVIWRAAAGTKPEGYLTPAEAGDALEQPLDAERAVLARGASSGSGVAAPVAGKNFGDVIKAWLEYVTDEKQLAPSTLRRYRGIAEVHLLPEFGAATPLRRITAERIDQYRSRLIAEDCQSRDSMRQILVALNTALKRALRKKWITHNR